jgi:hypothetical protein
LPLAFAFKAFGLERMAGTGSFALCPVENLGRRHSGRIDAKFFKRRLGAREMALGYHGKTCRKIL